MTTQTITTETDFGKQTYQNGVNETVEEPRHTIDPGLEKLFNPDHPLVLKYDGVSVLERGSFTGFPNVTLSHYAVGRFLKNNDIRPESIVDFGSGVGFLGNYASVHLGSKEIFFADLYPEAMQHAMAAYQLNHGIDPAQSQGEQHQFGARVDTGMHELDFRVGDARMTMANKAPDAAVMAPMFVPGVCEVFPQAYQMFEGIANESGTPLFIGHSNLALPQVDVAAALTGRKVDTHEIKTVPLRLEYSDGTPNSSLQRDSKTLTPEVEEHLTTLGLEVREDSGSREYFHKLMVSHIHD